MQSRRRVTCHAPGLPEGGGREFSPCTAREGIRVWPQGDPGYHFHPQREGSWCPLALLRGVHPLRQQPPSLPTCRKIPGNLASSWCLQERSGASPETPAGLAARLPEQVIVVPVSWLQPVRRSSEPPASNNKHLFTFDAVTLSAFLKRFKKALKLTA